MADDFISLKEEWPSLATSDTSPQVSGVAGLIAALKGGHEFPLFVPGGSGDVDDLQCAATYLERVTAIIQHEPTYELGVIDMKSAYEAGALFSHGNDHVPHRVCAVQWQIEDIGEALNEVFVVQQHGERI